MTLREEVMRGRGSRGSAGQVCPAIWVSKPENDTDSGQMTLGFTYEACMCTWYKPKGGVRLEAKVRGRVLLCVTLCVIRGHSPDIQEDGEGRL